MNIQEIAKKAHGFEEEINLNIDDILNKLTQELGEFNDAVQKYRGRFCKTKYETTEEVEKELGDLLLNIFSVCYRLGIDLDNPEKYLEATLNKFADRKALYLANASDRQ